MTKEQALDTFWNSFGIPAYDVNTVPDDAEFPRIAYEVATSRFQDRLTLGANLYYRSNSWREISLKKDEIANFIGDRLNIAIDGGYLSIEQGDGFAQRMSDDDDAVRRYYITIIVEFLTRF